MVTAQLSATRSQQYLDEDAVAQMTLQELLDRSQRFELLRCCWEVLQSWDPIHGAVLARTFTKHRESPEAQQLTPVDRAALDELYAWSIIASCEVQPEEVIADVLSKWTLLLMRDEVNLLARFNHRFTVEGEMDGKIVFRSYFLQALRRNSELLGVNDLDVPGEGPVKPTLSQWIAAYDRTVRHEDRTAADRLQFLQSFPPAKKLNRNDRQVLLTLLELVDELAKKPTTIGGLYITPVEQAPTSTPTQQVVEQYLTRPFSREAIQEAQAKILAERRQGKDGLALLNQAIGDRASLDVVACLLVFARERRLGGLLRDASFRQRFEPLVGAIDDPKQLLKAIVTNAVPDESEAAQLGAQLASLLVASGERDYLGLAVYSQRTNRYEWRV